MEQRDIDMVNEPIPNLGLLDRIMEKIQEKPEEWDQAWWAGEVRNDEGEVCGTSHCVAGWACAMNEAYKIDYASESLRVPETDPLSYKAQYGEGMEGPNPTPGLSRASFSEVAERDLGLTTYEADGLFDGDNDLDDVLIHVQEIHARAKRQQAAFNRLAEELIASVPEMGEPLKYGYLCPESREVLIEALKGLK